MRYSAIFSFLAIIIFASCASAGNFSKVDAAVIQDRYDESVAELEQRRTSLYFAPRDSVLYYLDKGMLSHYAGQYEESSGLLGSGEQAIEAAFTKSVTQGIGSYLLNDNVLEYAGEDYEDIYINAFNALNYYQRGDDEGALVEIRRMNNKLTFLATKYDVFISQMQKKAIEDGTEIPASPDAPSKFSDSALARFLGMLFYRAGGLEDDARIDSERIKLAFANAPEVYPYPAPSSLAGELDIPRGKARVNVIAFTGLAPVKEASTFRIPLPGPRWVKISLPELSRRPSAAAGIEVVFTDGKRFALELLEDMDAVAAETFKNKKNFIYTKTILRAAAKAVSSSAMAVAAEDEDIDATTSGVLSILSLATQVLAEVSEQADVRGSRYFPGKAWVGAINLDPGVYSFRVDFYNSARKVIGSERYDNVNVRARDLNLFEAFCLR